MLPSLRETLQERRLAALAAASAIGLLAAAAAIVLTAVSTDVAGLLALGTAGTAYYLVHYPSPYPDDQHFGRSFLRIFALSQLALVFSPAGDVADTVVTVTAIVLVGTLVAVSTVVDAREVSPE